MELESQKSLKHLNTFGIDVPASQYLKITSETALIQALKQHNKTPLFILSGGSNMLLTKSLDALVLHIAIKGITTQKNTENTVLVTAAAGENWHDFVQYCISKNYGGLENLSLIPGYVGSSPIQNIGAYGVELKDHFVSCEAIHISTGIKKIFSKEDCLFGYRNSFFKNEGKSQYVITSVTFRLTTKEHILNTSYGAIGNALSEKGISSPSIRDVADAVIMIRQSKLPDPKEIGNSGSFFKNPVISSKVFKELQQKFPEIPHYTISSSQVKVPAGWLIEKAGFKGKRFGDAGVHNKQALVLVNHGNATGKEILALAQKIQAEIKSVFGISLEAEVNIF